MYTVFVQKMNGDLELYTSGQPKYDGLARLYYDETSYNSFPNSDISVLHSTSNIFPEIVNNCAIYNCEIDSDRLIAIAAYGGNYYFSSNFPSGYKIECPNAINFGTSYYINASDDIWNFSQLKHFIDSLPDWTGDYNSHEFSVYVLSGLDGTDKLNNLIAEANDKNWTVYLNYY